MKNHSALAEAEHNEIMEALGRLADTVKRSYSDDDVDLYLSAFDPDAVVSMPGLAPARGHEELRTLFTNRPALPPGATFSVEPLELAPLSSDWAYAFGTDTLGLADGSKQTMTFLVLVRKTEAGWKTFREVLSADQAW